MLPVGQSEKTSMRASVFRFSFMNGHCLARSARQKSAISGCEQSQQGSLYSITSSARASSEAKRAPYGFGETRVATLALLIFTVFSGWCSCGVVITKFSAHAVTFRSSPTVVADTPMPGSASTRILAGKPPRAMCSAEMPLGLYRIRASTIRSGLCGPSCLEG